MQLEQSPYLNVLPQSRIQEALRFMGRSPDERLTSDVAREICVREGVKAMLTGSISGLGSHFVIDLNAVNAQTGDSLGRAQAEAESKEQVLKSLDKAASDLRQKLGESIGSVQKFTTPLQQATTSSLEALQAFTLGQAEHQKLDDEKAVPHLQRAIELDPNFAMAYATLGVSYGNLSQPKQQRENLTKAFDLKDRASEREKLYISAHYYSEVTGELDKSIAIYEQWTQTYPRDTVPRDNLALGYATTGQHEKALASALEGMKIDPKDGYAYQNAADAYERLGRFDEATAILDKAAAQHLGGTVGFLTRYDVAFLKGDEPGMQSAVAAAKGDSVEPIMFFVKGSGECSLGKVASARQNYAQAGSIAQKFGMKEISAFTQLVSAICEVEVGNAAAARPRVSAALALSDDPNVGMTAALILARAGDASQSQKLMERAAKESPTDTMVNTIWIPTTRAANQIHANQAAQAVASLEVATPYEMGSPPNGAGYWPMFVRGDAYLHMGDGAKAAAEYQKILDHRGIDPTNFLNPLARLGSGRAYALQGDKAKAKAAYQDFFAIWKDADPDVPILKDAKAEYAKLQ